MNELPALEQRYQALRDTRAFGQVGLAPAATLANGPNGQPHSNVVPGREV